MSATEPTPAESTFETNEPAPLQAPEPTTGGSYERHPETHQLVRVSDPLPPAVPEDSALRLGAALPPGVKRTPVLPPGPVSA